jgi:hypothetical protein
MRYVRFSLLIPLIPLAAVALAGGPSMPAANAQAARAATAISCTNPYSGATWHISVDYDRGTVDSNPAHINDGEMSWHDAKDNSNYTLDRKSGRLTVIVPSSTGGYFLYDQCKPED